MSIENMRVCQHCFREAGKGNFHSFDSHVTKKKETNQVTIREALNLVFIRSTVVDTLLPQHFGICTAYFQSLRILYKHFIEFQARGNEEADLSKLTRNLKMTEPPKPPVKRPPPNPDNFPIVRQRLINFGETTRGKGLFRTYLRLALKKEMRNFCDVTFLKDQVEATDDTNLWPMLYEELQRFTPLTLTVIEAIGGTGKHTKALDPKVGAGFCVLAIARSQKINRFQKTVGLILASIPASKDAFHYLNHCGVSVSLRSAHDCAKMLGNHPDVNELMDLF